MLKTTVSQLTPLSPPVGLGGEKLWLCPSLSKSGDTGQGFDLSGNVNNGYWSNELTLSSTMGLAADKEAYGSRAYSFDGVDEWMRLPTDIVPYDDPLTASAWLKLENSSDFFLACGKLDIINNEQSWGLFASGGSVLGLIAPEGTNNNRVTISGGTLDINWNHLCLTHDPSSGFLEIFLNGISVNSAVAGARFNSTYNNSLAAHSEPTIGQYGFEPGRLDDVRFFNRVLTPSEIKHLSTARGVQGNGKTRLKARYNEPAGVFVPRTNFLAWYRSGFDKAGAISPTTQINPIGLGGEKLWLCPSLSKNGDTGQAFDLSGRVNNGTYNGGMGTFVNTESGGTRAYELDGSDDYIDTGNGDSTDLRPGVDPLTFTAWIKPDTIAGGDTFSTTNPRYVIGKGGTVGGRWQYGWRILGGKLDFLYRNAAETTFCVLRADSSVVNAGEWQHIALVHDGTNATHYLNGSVVPSTVVSGSMSNLAYDSNEPVIIGKEPTQRYFDGLIDDVRIHSRVLTAAEIKHLATARGIQGNGRYPVRSIRDPQAGVLSTSGAGAPKTRTLLGVGL